MNYLITPAEVVALAFNDKNFLPGKILTIHLTIAHEGFLRPALGDDYYLHLMTGTQTEDDIVLIDNYLKAPLAMYVRYIILPDIIMHLSNTGVQLVQPQGSISASDRQAGVLRDQARENAMILMDSATRYIRQNATKFPLYSYSATVQSKTKILGGVIFGGGTARKFSAPVSQTYIINGMIATLEILRTKSGYANGEILVCMENNGVYQYDSTSTAADDGDLVIRPRYTNAGRWIKTKELQQVNL